MSLLRNQNLVTQDNPQTLLQAVSCRNYFLCVCSHYTGEKTDISAADILQTLHTKIIWMDKRSTLFELALISVDGVIFVFHLNPLEVRITVFLKGPQLFAALQVHSYNFWFHHCLCVPSLNRWEAAKKWSSAVLRAKWKPSVGAG